MCELVFRDKRIPINESDVIFHLTQLELSGANYFQIHRSKSEFMQVSWSPRRAVVIYVKYGEPYLCYNASTSAQESEERTSLPVGNEPTPFPKNMILSPSAAAEVIREFCRDGRRSSTVFWIRDGEKSAAKV